MPRKNKRSRFHTPFKTLHEADKKFLLQHYHYALHKYTLENKSLKQIWILGSQDILNTYKDIELPSGAKVCRHGYDKLDWKTYEKQGISCTLPTYDWAKDRRIQNSLINIKDFLYGWKDRPFDMAFIAPVNTPRGVDADIKVEAIRDIKGSLTMVRKVWKELLVNGRSMTVREAMWVSIISKGFEDVYASDALDEIVSSALHYAKEESAYELLSQTKDMGAFETNDYDAEHMIWNEAVGAIAPDANQVDVEHDIASALGEVVPRYKLSYNTKYSKELSDNFKVDTSKWIYHDNRIMVGVDILESVTGVDKETISEALKSNLFALGVRKIMSDAGFKDMSRPVMMWQGKQNKVAERVHGLLLLCQEAPSNERNVDIQDYLDVPRRKFKLDSESEDIVEAGIFRYGGRAIETLKQRADVKKYLITMSPELHKRMKDKNK